MARGGRRGGGSGEAAGCQAAARGLRGLRWPGLTRRAPLLQNKKKKKTDFIPYRDSVLTWLLRENLGEA